jgi:hypothetical protein
MVSEPTSGMLTLVCVKTAGEIAIGTRYSQDDLAKARHAKLLLRCPFCRQSHLFNFSDARLKPGDQESQGGAVTK